MSDPTDPLAWIAGAEEDYLLAVSALRRRRPLTRGACFHAQQCAEKCLKALLVAKGQAFPKTHDLLVLSSLNAQTGVLLPVGVDRLRQLSAYAVQVRYPGEEPTPDEARDALDTARAVSRFTRRLLGIR